MYDRFLAPEDDAGADYNKGDSGTHSYTHTSFETECGGRKCVFTHFRMFGVSRCTESPWHVIACHPISVFDAAAKERRARERAQAALIAGGTRGSKTTIS